MGRVLFVIFVAAISAGTAWGQATATTDQTETVKVLLERIEKLETRVNELEGKLASQSAPTSMNAQIRVAEKADPHATSEGAEHEQDPMAHTDQAATMPEPSTYPSLHIKGFADVDFSATDQRGSLSGFNLGQFVLHFVSPLSRKVSFFGETSFTAQPTGYALELERAIIRYDYNDYFKMSFGRYHTPVGYWNTAFHHGAWLQTTISRPEMVKFGGTFIPVHFVGLLSEGSIPSGDLGLNYNVGVGNGRASIISRAGDAGDSNNNRAWVINLFARPARIYGLQVGGSVYRDKITLPNGRNFREWITSAHVVWFKENPEFLAEFANVQHREVLTTRAFNSQAFYVQGGYRLPWLEAKWKPYYRFEYIHTPKGEPVLGTSAQGIPVPGILDLVGSTVGVRYDISTYAAFKGEYRYTKHGIGEPYVNGLFLQTAFTF